MRSEQEMMELILGTARGDERIRAAYMNGSRANPHAPRDIFQDYDICYVVGETASFRRDPAWIDRFGARLYMQFPEEGPYWSADVENCYGWLIQFADGNRLDLHVVTPARMRRDLAEERLCIKLLDKDGILPPLSAPTDADYWVKRPTQEQFHCTCNEFWWCLNNVAKGLWRREIPYAMDVLNGTVRPMLVRMLEWKAGVATGFSVSCGKSGKYLHRFLPPEDWAGLLDTYPAGEVERIWEATLAMCDLFHRVACQVAAALQLAYDETEARNSLAHLRHVRTLPRDATAIY